MKKRLLVFLLTALLIMSMAVSVFASPNVQPDYVRYLTNNLFTAGGINQDSAPSPYGSYEAYICPYCGRTCYVSYVMRYTWGTNDFNFQRIYNGVYLYAGYSEPIANETTFSIINNTMLYGNCVVNRGLNIYANVDVILYSRTNQVHIYTHAPIYAGVYDEPKFGAVFYGDTDVGSVLRNAINSALTSTNNNTDLQNILSIYAVRLNSVSLLEPYIMGENFDGYLLGYQDGLEQGDYDGYNRGYQNGYNSGRINGQSDAVIFDSFGSIFDDIFSGLGGFFESFFDIGIGEVTIGNMLSLCVTAFIIMLVVKIIRG